MIVAANWNLWTAVYRTNVYLESHVLIRIGHIEYEQERN